MKKLLKTIGLVSLFAFASESYAAKDIDPSKPGYIVLNPIVTNFIADEPGRMSYVKVDVSIAIESQANLEAAQLYIPEIRDAIVFLLNQQHKTDLDSVTERQILANKGLELVQEIFISETGEPYASEFLWGFFAIQS